LLNAIIAGIGMATKCEIFKMKEI